MIGVGQKTGWAANGTRYVPPPRRFDVVEEGLDGEAVLIDPLDGNSHQLNESALAVWKCCDGRSSTETIAASLKETYDVDSEDAFDYVNQLVALFAELKLLELPNDDENDF